MAKSPNKKKAASVLKKKGLLPSSWDLRKPLSSGQKSWLTKLIQPAKKKKDGKYQKPGIFHELIKDPSKYTTLKVDSKERKSKAIASGMPIVNGKAVTKAKSIAWTKEGVRQTRHNGSIDRIFYVDAKNFKSEYKRLSKLKMGPNQGWKLLIDGNLQNNFEKNFHDLMRYARGQTDMDLWHDGKFVSEHVAFALVTVDRQNLVKHHPRNK